MIADAQLIDVSVEPPSPPVETTPPPDKVVPRKESRGKDKVDKPIQPAQTTKSAEGTQNLARLPQREQPKPEPQQKQARVLDVGNIALPGPDLTEELSLRSIVKEAAVDEDLYLPPKMTPEKAIQMLKEMIQNRSGRWLVSAVLEEEGALVTSDKAFEVIAGEYTGISKHVLGGTLRRAQMRPLLKQRQGKLYLEVDKS